MTTLWHILRLLSAVVAEVHHFLRPDLIERIREAAGDRYDALLSEAKESLFAGSVPVRSMYGRTLGEAQERDYPLWSAAAPAFPCGACERELLNRMAVPHILLPEHRDA